MIATVLRLLNNSQLEGCNGAEMELETEPENRRQPLRALVQGEADTGRGHGGGCPVLKLGYSKACLYAVG